MQKVEKRKYYLWGTGKIAKQINLEYRDILQQLDIVGYIDNNQDMWGKQFEGKNVFAPEILNHENNAYLVIANAFKNEIIEQITESLDYNISRIEENFLQRLQLIDRYKESKDKEKKEIAIWLKENPLAVFNYSFTSKYANMECEIKYDVGKDLYFAMYQGKKMYFSRAFHSAKRAEQYFKWLCMEQDIESPHRYIMDIESLKNDLVIIDAGAAEGNFSLGLVEKAKKIYLFEPDEEWLEALKYTFEPYADKVVIIEKALSNYESVTTTTIDSVIEENVDIIKMDIEGEEIYALEGGDRVISNSPKLQCFVCTYHQEFAFDIIEVHMKQKGYDVEASKGYMWFPENPFSLRPPILRKGILRAIRKE